MTPNLSINEYFNTHMVKKFKIQCQMMQEQLTCCLFCIYFNCGSNTASYIMHHFVVNFSCVFWQTFVIRVLFLFTISYRWRQRGNMGEREGDDKGHMSEPNHGQCGLCGVMLRPLSPLSVSILDTIEAQAQKV